MKTKCGITVLAILILVNQAFCQIKGNPELVTISAEIIGKGNHSNFLINESCDGIQDGNNYFTLLSIANNQDTAIHFITMLCSWEENWTSNDDSVFLSHPCCDMNFPIEIKLEPHKSIKFYGLLRARYRGITIGKFKLGVMLPNLDIRPGKFNQSIFRSSLKSQTIYWSNELELEDPVFKFKIDGHRFWEMQK